MNIQFKGKALSALVPLPLPGTPVNKELYPQLWLYARMYDIAWPRASLESIDDLVKQGYSQADERTGAALETQLYEARRLALPNNTMQTWYKPGKHTPTPVILTFTVPDHVEIPTPISDTMPSMIPMLNYLPLPQHGEYAYVVGSDSLLYLYRITDLPLEARQHWAALGDALRDLSSPLLWPPFTERHQIAGDPVQYQRRINALTLRVQVTTGQRQTETAITLARLEGAKLHIEELQNALKKPDMLHKWMEVQRMAQDLADDYYQHHLKKSKGYTPPLPEMTSQHKTTIPSSNHFRAITQSFGRYVAYSLWSTKESEDLEITTPNGAILSVRGETTDEQRALYEFITAGLGAEGIKYMVTLLAAYHAQTNATDRKDDARVTLRQLLVYMGRDTHADDLDEQRKFMNYILYLARTWVTAGREVRDPRSRRKNTSYIEYSPLVILEALGSDERYGIKIPGVIEFHLGKEFYEQMFGAEKHFFTLPTALILGYHSVREQQEICLSVYLANMLNLNHGRLFRNFPTLLTETGMLGQADIDQGHDRTRDALRVIYAIERLERDGLIVRGPHSDIDTILAVELYSEPGRKAEMADGTLTRIYTTYQYFKALLPTELRRRRRIAAQHLLDTIENNSIEFKPGELISAQIAKRVHGTQLAIDKREQAQEAGLSAKKRKKK